LVETFQETRRQYNATLRRAESAWERRDLEGVDEACEELLELCPEATRPKSLQSDAEDKRRAARSALDRAESKWERAEFDLAEQEVSEAEEHWPSAPEIDEAASKLESVRQRYNTHRKKARRALRDGNYTSARRACNTMRDACPDAPKPDQIARKIDEQEEKSERRRSFAVRAGTSLGLSLLAVISVWWVSVGTGVEKWVQEAGPSSVLTWAGGAFLACALYSAPYYVLHGGPYFEGMHSKRSGTDAADSEANAAFLGALGFQLVVLLFWMSIGIWLVSASRTEVSPPGPVVLGLVLHIATGHVLALGWVRSKLEVPFTLLALDETVLDLPPDSDLERKRKPFIRGFKVLGSLLVGAFVLSGLWVAVQGAFTSDTGTARTRTLAGANGSTLQVMIQQTGEDEKIVRVEAKEGGTTYELGEKFSAATSIQEIEGVSWQEGTLVCFDAVDPEWRVDYCWDYAGDDLYYRAVSRSSGQTEFSDNLTGKSAIREILAKDSDQTARQTTPDASSQPDSDPGSEDSRPQLNSELRALNVAGTGAEAAVNQATWKGQASDMIDDDSKTVWQVSGTPDEITAIFRLRNRARVAGDYLHIGGTGGERNVTEYELYARDGPREDWRLVQTVETDVTGDGTGDRRHDFQEVIVGKQFRLVLTEHQAPDGCVGACDVPIAEYHLLGGIMEN
jgi:hypothetical protein